MNTLQKHQEKRETKIGLLYGGKLKVPTFKATYPYSNKHVKLKQRTAILIEDRQKKNNLFDRAHEWEWGTWQMRTEEMRPLCYDKRD